MEIKVAALVVLAVVATAVAYPYSNQQANTASLNCNDNAIQTATIGPFQYTLKGCQKSEDSNTLSFSTASYITLH